jgi:AraC family transcriptional regulator
VKPVDARPVVEVMLDVAIDWLYAGPMIQISRYRCHAAGCGVGREQRQPAHVIGFPHSGVFALHQGRERLTVEQGTVLFLNHGAPYRTSHPCGGGDHGAAIAVRPDVLVEALARFDPTVADRPAAPFRVAVGATSSRTYLLQRLLHLRVSRRRDPDSLELEEAALALVGEVAAAACRWEASALPLRALRERHHGAVHSVRALLAFKLGEPVSLEEVGKAVGVSPFHLCRVFRAVTGTTISRYRHTLRLRAALERVASPDADLSAVALDYGYSSHSHFTAAFGREFGMTPTEFRRAAARSRRNVAGLRAPRARS